ncbi:MAG: casein kinase 2 regulatory subunit [Lichina confinis]|nr:MAG: casein kinase 2 regulatory subunit [Lichina confinis]
MSSESPVGESWISSFCSLLGHEYFAEVSEDFIEDDFNLTGLQSQVAMYKEALEMILDVEPEEDDDDEDEDDEDEDEDEEGAGVMMDDRAGGGDGTAGAAGGYGRSTADRRHMRVGSDLSLIESSAEMLYGLIHQRYITSRAGIQQMAEKYDLQHFGVCPRVHCNRCRVLPVGVSDTPGLDTVKLFCPSCLDIYNPPNSRFQAVDGAFFGTTFGCLFFMTFPEIQIGNRADPAAAAPSSPNHGAAGGDKSRSSSASGLPIAAGGAGATAAASSSASAAATMLALTEQGRRSQPTVINGMLSVNLAPGLGSGKVYEPRIYGFRVSERAKSGPRMQWLRSRPTDLNEVDEARQFHEVRQGEANVGVDEGEGEGEDDEDEVDDEEYGLEEENQRDLVGQDIYDAVAAATRAAAIAAGEVRNAARSRPEVGADGDTAMVMTGPGPANLSNTGARRRKGKPTTTTTTTTTTAAAAAFPSSGPGPSAKNPANAHRAPSTSTFNSPAPSPLLHQSQAQQQTPSPLPPPIPSTTTTTTTTTTPASATPSMAGTLAPTPAPAPASAAAAAAVVARRKKAPVSRRRRQMDVDVVGSGGAGSPLSPGAAAAAAAAAAGGGGNALGGYDMANGGGLGGIGGGAASMAGNIARLGGGSGASGGGNMLRGGAPEGPDQLGEDVGSGGSPMDTNGVGDGV